MVQFLQKCAAGKKCLFGLFALCAIALGGNPTNAKSSAASSQRSQAPVCLERSPFGGFPQSLMDQDIRCWFAKLSIRRLPETPLAPGVQFVASSGEAGQRDELGILPSDWLKLSDVELLAIYLDPMSINFAWSRLDQGSINAGVLFYLIGDFVGQGEQRLAPAFSMAYPACRGFDPALRTGGACDVAYDELRRRISRAGYGAPFRNGQLSYSWSDFGIALGRSYMVRDYPRLRWLRFNREQAYTADDGATLIDLARMGFPPATRLLARLGNSCSGTGEVYGAMQRSGVSYRTVVDWAVAKGDAEAALSFSDLSRDGRCGASRDPQAVFDYALRAAELGNSNATGVLLALYANSGGRGRNPREAINALRTLERATPAQLAELEVIAGRFDATAAREGVISTRPSDSPNIATVRAVLLRELRWLYENFDGGIQSGLSQLFGTTYQWDEANGRLEMRQGGGTGFEFHSVQKFDVLSTRCTPVAGRQAFRCTSSVSTYLDAGLGQLMLARDVTTPARTVIDDFIFENGQWRSPTVRQRMLEGLRAPQSSSSAPAQSGQSALCRSLNAGVFAAGGSSTSAALSPSTWGC
jgi:hypothetical protein